MANDSATAIIYSLFGAAVTRVAERCGLVQEGQLRESHRNPDGTFSDDVLYGLLRSDYEG